ncbi:hypothetical protein PO25_07380 [Vibrio anguillarum]|uniref:hypothetical protein n=1 Tax=Vibrio anguillarum TaxID=55601 RepID=UPI00097E3E23|nr:hypothetical protein [Vibrio anguillarum]MBT2947707.1 hypothetical protein [Vibrio anguillarum]
MLTNAFASFSEVSTKILSDIFKTEFRTIQLENRRCSLNQGFQQLARNAGFNCYQSMQKQESALIRAEELIEALKFAGLSDELASKARYSRLLKCDVFCGSDQQLSVAVAPDGIVLNTPFLSKPNIPDFEFFSLNVHGAGGIWMTLDEWDNFVEDLEDNLDFNGDLEYQIEEIWNKNTPESCGELFLSSNPDWDDLADCTEGMLRACVLEHAGHTPLDLLYDYFSSERRA